MSLNFATAVNSATTNEIRRLCTMKAILDYHGSLPKDERGVASITLRTMVKHHLSSHDTLANEYFITFGAHGYAVLDKRLAEIVGSSIELRGIMESEYTARKQSIISYYENKSNR